MRIQLQKSAKKSPPTGARRRIKDATIQFISLCRRGVSKQPLLLKSDGTVEIATISKASADGSVVTSLIYPASFADGEGDFADPDAVKRIAHGYMRLLQKGEAGIDLEHNLKPYSPDQISVAQSYMVKSGDPDFKDWTDYDGKPVDATGGWAMVFEVHDRELRTRVASGELNGTSMFGPAVVEAIAKAAPDDNPPKNEKKKMDPKELEALIAKAVAAALAAKTEPAPAPAAPAAKPTLRFEGDPRDPAALAAFEEQSLLASLDLAKSEDMAKWRAHLAKSVKPAGGDPVAAQITALQAQIARLQKASAQPSSSPAPEGAPADDGVTVAGLAKSEFERLQKLGRDAAKAAAGRA